MHESGPRLRRFSSYVFPGGLVLAMVGFGVWFDHLSDQAGAVSVRAVELALDSHLDPTEIEWLAWRGPAAPHSGASAVPFRRPS